MNINNALFIKSAATARDIPDEPLPEIVFSGKSNVGKSSVINKLLNRRNIARVSSTPGKTVHINYFLIDSLVYFVDLPGYGYAKVAKAERDRWSKLMEAYFSDTSRIALGVMIVDARHPPTRDDITMGQLFKSSGRPFVVCANKADKVKSSAVAGNMDVIRDTLELPGAVRIIPFSAEKGTNRETLLGQIENAATGWNKNAECEVTNV